MFVFYYVYRSIQNPDIIIAADFFKQEMIQSLRDLGLKVYVYKTPNNMEEIKKAINDIAVLVGEPANAEKLIRQMDSKLKSVKNKVGSIKPSETKYQTEYNVNTL